MASVKHQATGKDQPADTKAKGAEQAKSEPPARELTEKELGGVTGGGVTNTGTSGVLTGSGGGRTAG